MGLKRELFDISVIAMRRMTKTRNVKTPLRIFVLRNNDLGDVVVITPIFEALRRAFPDAYIAAGVGKWARPILENNPYVSEIVECNAPWHNRFTNKQGLVGSLKYIFGSRESRDLADQCFDIGIDILGSSLGSMLLLKMRIPIRLGRKGYAGGHSGSTGYISASNPQSVAQNALEFLKLLERKSDVSFMPQLYLTENEIQRGATIWNEILSDDGKKGPKILIGPGAGTKDKEWPVENFRALALALKDFANGFVIGSATEDSPGELIVQGITDWGNKCGELSLRESMALVASADLVICNASMIMHLAAAFQVPCIVILSPVHDPIEHGKTWEIKGLHFQVYPKPNELLVSVKPVFDLALELLKRKQSSD
jgi:ADP-heptose:LPS heptosyltransferase